MFDEFYAFLSKIKSKEQNIHFVTFIDVNDKPVIHYPSYESYKENFAITRFNAGELYTKVPLVQDKEISKIIVNASYPCEEFSLALLFDALNRTYPSAYLELKMDYLPHGRQDRACKEGESFSSNVFFNLLKSVGVSQITTLDLHSPTLKDIAAPLVISDQLEKVLPKFLSLVQTAEAVLCPDKGAYNRCNLLGKLLNIPVLYCQKERAEDITVTVPKEINKYKNIVVFDDICDAGGTFLELKKHIPDTIQTTLLVSHGIFANDARVKLYDAGYSQVYALRYQ